MLIALLAPLVLAILLCEIILVRTAISRRAPTNPEAMGVAAIVSFFDTLGMGSFAVTAAWLKFRRLVPEGLIPQTMLVGLMPPAMAESITFLALLGVLVDPALLVGCVIALLVGSLVGVPLVTRARVWIVQHVVAMALVLAPMTSTTTNLHLCPGGGTASSRPLTLVLVATIANFIFGVLVNLGVGNFAPTLVMFSLMGLDPRYVFPIMAVGAALTGTAASIRHIQIGQIDLRIVLGLALGGIPTVLVASFLVKSMRSKCCAGW